MLLSLIAEEIGLPSTGGCVNLGIGINECFFVADVEATVNALTRLEFIASSEEEVGGVVYELCSVTNGMSVTAARA